MLLITDLCKKYGKQAEHFTDNKGVKDRVTTVRGRYNAGTSIPDDLLTDFLIWLSPETRRMVGEIGASATLERIRKTETV